MTVAANPAAAQLFELPPAGPPIAIERGTSPPGLSLTEEGPAVRPEPETPAEVEEAAPVPPPPRVAVPYFRDPRTRSRPPELADRSRLRFLTVSDFEPFSGLDARGRPRGYHVELVRAVCEVLDALDRCQLQVVPWGQLRGNLLRGDGDAVIAGLVADADARETLGFTEPYLRFPARFTVRKGVRFDPDRPGSLPVGVVAGSAHEAMLAALFPEARIQPLPDTDALREALAEGRVGAAFSDGATTAAWLATSAGGCCEFTGGPYLSERFLGRGLTIAVRADDVELRDALDWALAQVEQTGKAEEIYLRTFPVGFY